MIRVEEVIIVEGRYDKNALSQIVDAVIIETSGFGIFSDKERLRLIRKMADLRGIIVLTDSDSAGFVIRNYIRGAVDPAKVKHAYIPDIQGKEKRKSAPSKEGKIGVEGMTPDILKNALIQAGATINNSICKPANYLKKSDLYTLGLSGRPDSAAKRRMLKKLLALPERLSVNALLDIVNATMSREEFYKISASL